MAVDRADIEKVAQLARLKIEDKDIEATTQAIADILNLVDQLQAADTQNIAPMSHPLDALQRLRADKVTETNQREANQAVAPATENGLYLVPKVID